MQHLSEQIMAHAEQLPEGLPWPRKVFCTLAVAQALIRP